MPNKRRRRVAVAGLLALAAFVAVGGWTAVRALEVRDHLELTRDALLQLRTIVNTGDPAELAGSLHEAEQQAAEARDLTGGAGWSLLERVPVAGDGATVVRALAETADELTGVLSGVEEIGSGLVSSGTHSATNLRKPLADLDKAAPALEQAVTRLDDARSRLAATPADSHLTQVDEARATVLRETDRLRGWVQSAATAARLLPAMLGSAGPRRYFLAFQTNAEARGTGGLVGAFGILKADHGHIAVERLASNTVLDTTTLTPVADLGPDYQSRYGPGATRLLSVSNLSPHFPYAAQIWTGLWQRQTGQRLDGAIATDPVGLSYLLRLIGPVALPGGEKVTADNVVDLTERAAYERYQDPAERKRFLIGIAEAVSQAMTGHFDEPAKVLPVLSQMIDERRLQVWSRRETEQRLLDQTALAGELPSTPGPYAGLVVNNSAGGKLDYYLNRSLDYDLGPCYGGERFTRIRIGLGNDVPRQTLPSYVTSRLDRPDNPPAVGANRLWVSLYAGVGARLYSVRMDGRPITVDEEKERSHPIFSKMIELPPRQSRTLEFTLVEPYSNRPPQVPVQPLVRPQRTTITQSSPGCIP
ncbi:DUF4012 domain-containing protein [Nonomuraea sp. NPDC050536]|uniref:DUF4012 domain-containing protein n=1 Tax=Nonomuraea sp. NPDC050536 TaxID=3364366 RepID=UPI0037C6D515